MGELIGRACAMQRVSRIGLLLGIFVAFSLDSSADADDALSADDLQGKRIVFVGDSITQAGGYISFVQYFLEKTSPSESFDVLGLGLASETLSGLSEPNHAGGRFPRPCLFERLGRLLEKSRPDVVFACYGMNDGIYMPLDDKRFAAFKEGVQQLMKDCRGAGVSQIVLITPPIYDLPPGTEGFNYDSVLTAYGEWEKTLRGESVQVIDLHTAMGKARDDRETPFSRDRVHPGEEGHWLMAQVILDAIGVDTGDMSLAEVKADGLYQAVAQLRKHRSSSWMSHIGYTREKTVKPSPLDGSLQKEQILRRKVDELK